MNRKYKTNEIYNDNEKRKKKSWNNNYSFGFGFQQIKIIDDFTIINY